MTQIKWKVSLVSVTQGAQVFCLFRIFFPSTAVRVRVGFRVGLGWFGLGLVDVGVSWVGVR